MSTPDEDRIREKAQALWEADGQPLGRDDWFWSQAKEIVALEDSADTALRPVAEEGAEPVEPAGIAANFADAPGLDDLGEASGVPSHQKAAALAEVAPLSVDLEEVAQTKASRTRKTPRR